MPQSSIRYRSDNTIFLRAPTDWSDINDPKPMTGDGGAYTFTGQPVTARLYDAAKRTFSTAIVPEGDSIIPVDSANAFEVGDRVELHIRDLNVDLLLGPQLRIVTAVDKLVDTIEIAVAIGVNEQLDKGSIVQAQLGADIPMTESTGTPVINTDLQGNPWGYTGSIGFGHEGLSPGMSVRLECVFYSDQEVNDYPVLQDLPVLEQSG